MEAVLKEKYVPDKFAYYGNKYFTGNGYIGIRGTLDEARADRLPAVNLSGVYDGLPGKWRETVNLPNPFYAYLMIDDEIMNPDAAGNETTLELDLENSEVRRTSIFRTRRGNVNFTSERFADMKSPHAAGQRFTVSADFHADITLVTGIDSKVWDINGPHLESLKFSVKDGFIEASALTQEKGTKITVCSGLKTDFPCQQTLFEDDGILAFSRNFVTDRGREYVLEKTIFIDHDGSLFNSSFEDLRAEHRKKWAEIREDAFVEIEGDDAAELALNYSVYQLCCIAPVPGSRLSIPARGLSGQTYKGAVFWDTEMFMMDLFLNTRPEIAKEFIRYRIDGLPGALEKAAKYGYEGAFYAWESQENGKDACSDYNVTDVFTGRPLRTFFKDKQVHISSAIVYAADEYMRSTGDRSILSEGAAKMIFECAKFYKSLLVKRVTGEKYEIRDVIGPDEYHERVNNNGYTNRMAVFTLKKAAELLKKNPKAFGFDKTTAETWAAGFLEDAEKLYIPEPGENGVIPQFDGYFELEDTRPGELKKRLLDPKEYWGGAYGVASQTQVIKQADVIAWLAMFPADFGADIVKKNWDYYEPRTEHGSSLSSCMYGLAACECNMPDKAYDMFMKSASADLIPGGKEWAGLVYIGGIHPAAHGGAYMLAMRGFAGMKTDRNGHVSFRPKLPANWKSMKFRYTVRGKKYEAAITNGEAAPQIKVIQ